MNSRQRKLAEERRVRKLYDRIPEIECKGLCHTTCGPIALGEVEQRMVAKAGVRLPIIKAEDAAHVKPTDCPALTEDKKCSVYDSRPAVCRMWGVAESMPCIYGCEPESVISDAESWWILGKANGDVPNISVEELERRHREYPHLRRTVAYKRKVGIEGDIRRARKIHGPDVKLVDDAQLGLTAWANLDPSDPQA